MKTLTKILLLSFILLAIQSCYKRKDTETIRGTITFIDTVNNVGVSGVKYYIIEEKDKIKGFETTVFMEGETDQNGKAYFEFERPKNKKKWGYYLDFDSKTFPKDLKYDSFDFRYWGYYLDSRMPLHNVYNEYDNNDVSIYFYP